jgi:hypothetical protein
LKVIRFEYLRRSSDWNSYFSKVDHVIREGEGEDNDLLLIKLNSQFEFANMQWIPKIVKYSKLINSRIITFSKIDLTLNFELLM